MSERNEARQAVSPTAPRFFASGVGVAITPPSVSAHHRPLARSWFWTGRGRCGRCALLGAGHDPDDRLWSL